MSEGGRWTAIGFRLLVWAFSSDAFVILLNLSYLFIILSISKPSFQKVPRVIRTENQCYEIVKQFVKLTRLQTRSISYFIFNLFIILDQFESSIIVSTDAFLLQEFIDFIRIFLSAIPGKICGYTLLNQKNKMF